MNSNNLLLGHILGKVEMATIQKRIQGKRLKQTERNYLSRSIRPKLLAAKLLTDENILGKIQRPDKSIEKKILFNLTKYGYDLINTKKLSKQKTIEIEELISIIITRSPQPRFIEAIPFLILKNKIDKFKLAELGRINNIINELGYLIETASILARKYNRKETLSDLLIYLETNKENRIRYLGEQKDQEYLDFLIKTSPRRIKKWNLLGRYFDEDFIKLGESYL